jgi:hypothetical protein
MHAAKYPSCHVGGFLIGSVGASGVIVSDVVPAVHGYPVGFVLELGASIANSLCKGTENQQVVGYYFGNDAADDEAVPAYVNDVMTDIQATAGSSSSSSWVLARVDFKALAESNGCIKVSVGCRMSLSFFLCAYSDCFFLPLVQCSINGSSVSSRVDTQLNRLRPALSPSNLAQFADVEGHMDSKGGVADYRNEFIQSL